MATQIKQAGRSIKRVSKSLRGTALLVAAATATLSSLSSQAAVVINVTSVKTQLSAGTPVEITGDNGVATAGSYSGFKSTKVYNVLYEGNVDKVLSVTGGGVTYNATGLATNVVRRVASNANNDQLWFMGSGNATSSTLSLNGPATGGFSQAFDENNLYIGADNLFSNTGNAVGDNSNVTRLDLMFGGFHANSSSAFAIFDRGPSNDHDAFKIAAITAVDSTGKPSMYGPLISYGDGTWGTTNVMPTAEELILRKNNSAGSDTFHPSDITSQGIGGVIVPTSTLVSTPGEMIYGYSLFSPAVTATGSGLDNWQGFALANSTSTGGGLDPAATVAVLFTASPQAAVPEPASLAVGTLAGASLLVRRRRTA